MIDLHPALSEQTVHLRYLGFLKHKTLISHERLVRICFSDYDREIPLVVEWIQAGPDNRQFVAVALLIPALEKSATGLFWIRGPQCRLWRIALNRLCPVCQQACPPSQTGCHCDLCRRKRPSIGHRSGDGF